MVSYVEASGKVRAKCGLRSYYDLDINHRNFSKTPNEVPEADLAVRVVAVASRSCSLPSKLAPHLAAPAPHCSLGKPAV
jgi:hypothetical protein